MGNNSSSSSSTPTNSVMDTNSVFRSLTAGVRFNKNKLPKRAADAFQPQPSTSKVTLDGPSASHSATVKGAVKAKKTGKNKRERDVDEEQTGGQGDSDDSDAQNAPATDDDDGTIRRRHRIRCTGSDVPALWQDFFDFPNLTDQVIENLASMTVLSPTPIQMQAASVMHARRDLLACAPTGSGKTLAYLLPLLCHHLDDSSAGSDLPVAIIVEPTRELARQVFSEAGKIGHETGWRVSLLGDDDNTHSTSVDVASSPHVVVTTPLKLVYAIKQAQIDLSGVQFLVLDEADKLFELGFLEQTDEIIAACKHPQLRKAMFSATIPSGVEELAKSVMGSDVVRVIIGQSNSATASITQSLTFAGNEDGKLVALKNLIRSGGLTPPALIFVQSVDRAKDLNKELLAYNVKSDLMHAERTREERDRVVERFAEGKVWVLVCTDVMSRGVDFRGVELVINYDFPQGVQSYIHRIGRTGRAGRSGKAITFFTKDDASYLKSIVNVMRNSGCEVPGWMLGLKAPTQKEKKQLKRKPVERKDVSASTGSIGGGTGSRNKKLKKARKDAAAAANPDKAGARKQSAKTKGGKGQMSSDYSEDEEEEG